MGLDEVAAVIDVSKKECAQKAVGVRVVVVLVVVGEVPRDIDERLGILRKRVDLDAKVRSKLVQACSFIRLTNVFPCALISMEMVDGGTRVYTWIV